MNCIVYRTDSAQILNKEQLQQELCGEGFEVTFINWSDHSTVVRNKKEKKRLFAQHKQLTILKGQQQLIIDGSEQRKSATRGAVAVRANVAKKRSSRLSAGLRSKLTGELRGGVSIQRVVEPYLGKIENRNAREREGQKRSYTALLAQKQTTILLLSILFTFFRVR